MFIIRVTIFSTTFCFVVIASFKGNKKGAKPSFVNPYF